MIDVARKQTVFHARGVKVCSKMRAIATGVQVRRLWGYQEETGGAKGAEARTRELREGVEKEAGGCCLVGSINHRSI